MSARALFVVLSVRQEDAPPLRVTRPLHAFREAGAARSWLVAQERLARQGAGDPNPALFGGADRFALASVTRLTDEELVSRLTERGLPLPPALGPHQRNWRSDRWWRSVRDRVADEDRPWLWGLFDHVWFHAVSAVPLAPETEAPQGRVYFAGGRPLSAPFVFRGPVRRSGLDPGRGLLACFADRADAERYAESVALALRRHLPLDTMAFPDPLGEGQLHYALDWRSHVSWRLGTDDYGTSWPLGVLQDWLAEHGLPPFPSPSRGALRPAEVLGWLHRLLARATVEQRTALLVPFDRLWEGQVVELELD